MRVLKKGLIPNQVFVPRVCRLQNVSNLVRSAGTGAALKVVVRFGSETGHLHHVGRFFVLDWLVLLE